MGDCRVDLELCLGIVGVGVVIAGMGSGRRRILL